MKTLIIIQLKLMEIHIQLLIGNLSGVMDLNKSYYKFWAAGFVEGAENNIGSDTSYLNLLNQSSEFLEKGLKIGSYIDGVQLRANFSSPSAIIFEKRFAVLGSYTEWRMVFIFPSSYNQLI